MDDLSKLYNSYLYRQFCEPKEKEEILQLNLKQTTNLRVESDRLTLKYIGKGLHQTDVAVILTFSNFKKEYPNRISNKNIKTNILFRTYNFKYWYKRAY